MPPECEAGDASCSSLGADIHAMHAGIRLVKERYAPFFPRSS